jgi:glutamate/tyrosine decarboxylase-like PLP-dependent enzyme
LAQGADAGLTGVAGPRFFGKVIGGSHPVGVAADWLTSLWGQNSGSYLASPANAVIEQVVTGWLLNLLSLPLGCSIGLTTGATMASFVCLAAARGEVLRRVGWNADADGLFGAPEIRVCIGDDAHAALFAALRYLGLGHDRVTRIATDEAGRMQATSLSSTLESCKEPLIVIAQAGQINTGAFDAFKDIKDIVHRHGGWLHVDGAFGLWARACPSLVHLTVGVEEADSWATDGHKWLQAPYDCGYAIVRDAQAHKRAMAYEASYLPPASEGCREPFHYVPELSRRARGFATWALIRALGRSGIAAMIEQHCLLARRMAERLASEPGVEVLNRVEINQFVVQFGVGAPPEQRDALTRAVVQGIQVARVCYVAEAHWRGRVVMRFSVISWATTSADIDRSADSILAVWRQVKAGATEPENSGLHDPRSIR